MNDKARLETLRLLQTRPRGSDIPELKGTFPFKPETLIKGVSSFLEIAKSLIGTNRYIEEWRGNPPIFDGVR